MGYSNRKENLVMFTRLIFCAIMSWSISVAEDWYSDVVTTELERYNVNLF